MSIITLTVGTQIIFADHAGDWVAGGSKTSLQVGTPTEVALDLTSLGDDAGRESVKADLGANRPTRIHVAASIEGGTMTTGERIDFFWAPSNQSTAGDGNPQQIDGADAAAPSGIGTLDELLATCIFIGSLIVENTAAAIQSGPVGVLASPTRWGILVVVNRSGATLAADAVEHHVVFDPIIEDVT